MFIYAHMHAVCICGGQRLMSGVFLSHSTTSFLRQRLSQNLDLTDSATLAG